ncbi:hypothetical protein PI124_g18094 [Phytophthora idaei]|nr:hypothetical protein PI125_g18617 [Phytophthora idaei]KAG3137948.1 hypothetical protein PI126_g17141 [Phytophthora idaei]KAG3236897.1 hypothetical protein PI124_g18094 [Phytophthora idaei]
MRDAIMTAEAIEEYVSRGHAHRRMTSVVEKLRELDSVYVKLQAEKRTLAEVWLLFDTCADKYPIMADYLSPSAEIFHSPLFESAIVKLQNELPLPTDERRAVEGIVLPPSAPQVDPTKKTDFAASVLQDAKRPRLAGHVDMEYDPLLLCAPPTSNTFERLFSGCKLILTSLRASTLPANFETVMFLRANRSLWNCGTLLGCPEEYVIL